VPMQPGPPCKGWIRPISPSHWSVRCKHCANFYSALAYIKSSNKQLHAIYEKIFKENPVSRRAFIVRSHKVRARELTSWITKELHARWSKHNSLKGNLIRTSIDGHTFHNNYTSPDMNLVATCTQEHPHCHVLAIPRCITCPPCSSSTARFNSLCYMVNGQGTSITWPRRTAAWWHSGRAQ
jgi:hypothetical protein